MLGASLQPDLGLNPINPALQTPTAKGVSGSGFRVYIRFKFRVWGFGFGALRSLLQKGLAVKGSAADGRVGLLGTGHLSGDGQLSFYWKEASCYTWEPQKEL